MNEDLKYSEQRVYQHAQSLDIEVESVRSLALGRREMYALTDAHSNRLAVLADLAGVEEYLKIQ